MLYVSRGRKTTRFLSVLLQPASYFCNCDLHAFPLQLPVSSSITLVHYSVLGQENTDTVVFHMLYLLSTKQVISIILQQVNCCVYIEAYRSITLNILMMCWLYHTMLVLTGDGGRVEHCLPWFIVQKHYTRHYVKPPSSRVPKPWIYPVALRRKQAHTAALALPVSM